MPSQRPARGQHTRARLKLLSGPLVAVLVSTSLPASSHATEIGLQFASQEPATNTAMTLHIRYTKPGDPNAKPSPIRRIQIDAPTGTVFNGAKVPSCHASDAEVMALGPSACPSDSQIADGTIVVITGGGPPFDPFNSPTPVFNDGNGWLEVSQASSTPATIAVTRLGVTGSRISGNIATAPGGPPDFESAVSTVDLSFPAASGYVTTPQICPAVGEWITTGTFTFADGRTLIVQGDTPCIGASGDVGDGRCTRLMNGTDGDDYIHGDGSSQKIDGALGDDQIRAGGGADCVSGGRGNDRLRPGTGRDGVRGGRGADVIQARGGGRDRIRCGQGLDAVHASRNDRVGRSCEQVRGAL
jgi:Ca2+-binding RTX toxin-like protein